MKILTCPMLAALAFLAGTALAETTFTYQGRLGAAGQPASGPHDFVFRLFDAESDGVQVGGDVELSPVDISGGNFAVELDFGDSPFSGAPRWLEIRVRASGSGEFTTLTPRQRIGAAPFAIETLFVAPGSIDTAALQDGAVTAAKIADQAVTRSRIKPDAIGTQQIENNSVNSADIQDGAVTTTELADGAVTTGKIAERAVTRIRMANNAVDTAVIADRSITANDIFDYTITTEKFVEGAVDSTAIATGAVTSAKLAPGAVTASRLAPNAVGSSNVQDGSLTIDDLAFPALYTSKSQLERRFFSLNLIGDARTRISASCDGPADLPIGGSCEIDESLLTWIRVQSTRYRNWTDATLQASVECEFYNAGNEISTIRSVI